MSKSEEGGRRCLEIQQDFKSVDFCLRVEDFARSVCVKEVCVAKRCHICDQCVTLSYCRCNSELQVKAGFSRLIRPELVQTLRLSTYFMKKAGIFGMTLKLTLKVQNRGI